MFLSFAFLSVLSLYLSILLLIFLFSLSKCSLFSNAVLLWLIFVHPQGRQRQYSRTSSDFNLLESSLDIDTGDLAEASFHLLRAQEWFDAILILDDSSSSDRLRFKLSNLCKSSLNPTTGSSSSSSSASNPTTASSSFASVWNRLMTVQVSKSLLQNEVSPNSE